MYKWRFFHELQSAKDEVVPNDLYQLKIPMNKTSKPTKTYTTFYKPQLSLLMHHVRVDINLIQTY